MKAQIIELTFYENSQDIFDIWFYLQIKINLENYSIRTSNDYCNESNK